MTTKVRAIARRLQQAYRPAKPDRRIPSEPSPGRHVEPGLRYKTFFDQRRPLAPPLGLPVDMKSTSIMDAAHRALLDDPAIVALLDSDATPIPAAMDREHYYGDRHLEYWLSGQADWRKLLPYVDPAKPDRARYLDMGGSTGRVVRHAVRHPGIECWLSDINVNSIDWINKHFAYPLTAYQSRIWPTIPAEDRTFDLVSAFSVFSHLDCNEVQWLLELRRVLRRGGHLYVTVHDENVWGKLSQPGWEWLLAAFSCGNSDAAFVELVKRPLPAERFVREYSGAEAYNINTFLSSAYIKTAWSRYFDIVGYLPWQHNYQSVVVLRKA